MNNYEISGNGVVFNIFHYLWLHDQMTKAQPNLRIPDTIQYILGEAKFWYFTSKEGLVRRKSKIKIRPQEIYDSFTKNIPQCQVVAVFIQFKNSKNNDPLLPRKKNTGLQMSEYIYDYMNLTEFEEFIFKQDFYRQGILQRFIQPKGEYNYVIKTIWSKQLCLFEVCKNKFYINDQKADIFQRVSTFESLRSPCQIEPLKGKVLPINLEIKCDAIATHIFNVTKEKFKVLQMSLYWKVDVKEQLYLLLCQDLTTLINQTSNHQQDESNYELHPSTQNFRSDKQDSNKQKGEFIYKMPDRIDESRLSYPLPTNLQKKEICFKCHNLFDVKQIFVIKYKNQLNIKKKRKALDINKINDDQTTRFGDQPKKRESFVIDEKRTLIQQVTPAKKPTVCNQCYLEMLNMTKPNNSIKMKQIDLKLPKKLIDSNLKKSLQRIQTESLHSNIIENKNIDQNKQRSLSQRNYHDGQTNHLFFLEQTIQSQKLNKLLRSTNRPITNDTSNERRMKYSDIRNTIKPKLNPSDVDDIYGLEYMIKNYI